MNAQHEVLANRWMRSPAPWLVLCALALPLTFLEVFQYFVSVWTGSNTFSHGFFVIPMALFFAWGQRYRFIGLPPAISRSGAALLVCAIAAEFLGYVFSISIIQQLAVVGVMVCSVITFVGWKIALRLWFPLSLLAFVPPIGNELLPIFQTITADLSVWMLGITPIPVHHDGLYITVPGHVFEVAEACSGIRFFITCVFLGYIYAAINFTSLHKRILFLLFSVALPIIANGVRVFGIIVLGYYVDMKYAKGFDHLFVGWVFFFIVTGVLLLVGFLFADKATHTAPVAPHEGWWQQNWRKAFLWVIIPMGLSVLLKVSMNLDEPNGHIEPLREPESEIAPSRDASWSPHIVNPDGTLAFSLQNNRPTLDVFIGWYNDDKPGAELLTGGNRLFDPARWSHAGGQAATIELTGGARVDAQVVLVVSAGGARRFILYWYDVPGMRSANTIKIKLYQGLNKITHEFRGGKLLVVSGIMRPEDTVDGIVASLQQQGVFDVVDQATGLRQ